MASAICPIIALAFITFGYWSWCQIRPFKPCRKCRGAGVKRLMLRRTRRCTRCQGTGYVIRLGPKMANHLRRFARELDRGRK
ncbi:MAG TPA: hypothetical protein DGT23_26890 [Micromonosporaceae bacterium]|nr:hypothetical protein [Micromonosporaceae bacterium]